MLGRQKPLFQKDITEHNSFLTNQLFKARCLVIGGAGSIGQAVTRELFKRNPATIHVVDVSENNLVELVRDIRSSTGYSTDDFRTYAIDCGSSEFEAMLKQQKKYDYVFNLSALKHVRSEKDPFTLMRMVYVNIFNTIKTIRLSNKCGAKKYFCVSTDKAANPVNMMGASKRIMELFAIRESLIQPISMARFANVAFSDGSLLHGFNQRFVKRQPIAAPKDIKRYFITSQESGELCIMSALLGQNRDIFFPKLSNEINQIYFSDIVKIYLREKEYDPYECSSEEEAKLRAAELISQKKWPCFFFESDTTGEKTYEEFFTSTEYLDMKRFYDIGVIKNNTQIKYDDNQLDYFYNGINLLNQSGNWSKQAILDLFTRVLPDFNHYEKDKYLDERM